MDATELKNARAIRTNWSVDSTHPSILGIERFVRELAIVKKIFTNFAKGFDAPQ